jgi:hypothetical protein
MLGPAARRPIPPGIFWDWQGDTAIVIGTKPGLADTAPR